MQRHAVSAVRGLCALRHRASLKAAPTSALPRSATMRSFALATTACDAPLTIVAAAAVPRRAFSSSAVGASAPLSPSQPAPALFGFPFGLDEHDELLANYREALGRRGGSAPRVLADLQRTLHTEAHALELEEALRGKCAKQPAAATASTVDLASRTELWSADVQSIVSELTVERVDKSWVIHAPSASASSAQLAGVRFESAWSTSLHSIRRELAPCSFHAKLTATPFTLTALSDAEADPARTDDPPATLMLDQPATILLDVTESDGSRVDSAALDSLRTSLAAPAMSARDFAWFVAFMASHPTDLAFDVFSETLLRGQKQNKNKN